MIPRTCRTCDQTVYGPPFNTVEVMQQILGEG